MYQETIAARDHQASRFGLDRKVALERRAFPGRFRFFTYTFVVLGTAACLLLGLNSFFSAVLVSALLFGWSEINGLCGTSHIGSITPILTLGGRAKWFACITAYTFGGILTASLIGAMLGYIGGFLPFESGNVVFATAFLGVVLAVRELDWIRFRLPQVRRQTVKMWANEFGLVPAALMWGMHIGIGFATVIRHGGFFVLVALALAFSPMQSALLFATYWIGRTIPIWIAPRLVDDSAAGDQIGIAIQMNDRALRVMAAAGLVSLALIILVYPWMS